MKAVQSAVGILVACVGQGLFAADTPSTTGANSWSAKAAAAYLDGRLTWWMTWPNAARDHETFCVSCHTVAPYGVGRAALRTALGEQGPSAVERKVLDNITKRVRLWNDVKPFYPDKGDDPKTAESRGTESILNALVLTNYDARSRQLSPDTRL